MGIHDMSSIKDICKCVDNGQKRDIIRGEIYYVKSSSDAVGCEQSGTRPAIIVSNDVGNKYSTIKEVVFLTTRAKPSMPTHVIINTSIEPSIAMCEQITTVDDQRIKEYIGKCSKCEMQHINAALAISLALRKDGQFDTVQKESKLFDPGDDEILQKAKEHIDRIIELAGKVLLLKKAMNDTEHVEIPSITGKVSKDTEEMIQKFVQERIIE